MSPGYTLPQARACSVDCAQKGPTYNQGLAGPGDLPPLCSWPTTCLLCARHGHS